MRRNFKCYVMDDWCCSPQCKKGFCIIEKHEREMEKAKEQERARIEALREEKFERWAMKILQMPQREVRKMLREIADLLQNKQRKEN